MPPPSPGLVPLGPASSSILGLWGHIPGEGQPGQEVLASQLPC